MPAPRPILPVDCFLATTPKKIEGKKQNGLPTRKIKNAAV